MHKLTLDPSTKMGWCLYLDKSELLPRGDGHEYQIDELLFHGTWDLTRDIDGKKCVRRGQYYINFLECFRRLRRLHNIDEAEIKIALEGEAYAANRTEASARLAAGWIAVLDMYCERKCNPYPVTVTTDSWRKAFTGFSRAPKEIKGTNERRDWIKAKVLEKCASRGLNPRDDNEADALGIMYWLMNNGEQAQADRRAEKKSKTAEKRAQKKLDLQVAA